MWKKDYECEYLHGDVRGCLTNYKHPLGYSATHDSARQDLIIQDEKGSRIMTDFRSVCSDSALTVLNRDYD